jgi:hypothetical protein
MSTKPNQDALKILHPEVRVMTLKAMQDFDGEHETNFVKQVRSLLNEYAVENVATDLMKQFEDSYGDMWLKAREYHTKQSQSSGAQFLKKPGLLYSLGKVHQGIVDRLKAGVQSDLVAVTPEEITVPKTPKPTVPTVELPSNEVCNSHYSDFQKGNPYNKSWAGVIRKYPGFFAYEVLAKATEPVDKVGIMEGIATTFSFFHPFINYEPLEGQIAEMVQTGKVKLTEDGKYSIQKSK